MQGLLLSTFLAVSPKPGIERLEGDVVVFRDGAKVAKMRKAGGLFRSRWFLGGLL